MQEFATLGACLAGGGAALGTGHAAGSIALVCYGFGSLLNVAFAGLAIRKLSQPAALQAGGPAWAAYERWILYVTGAAFFVLMLFVLHEAGLRLSHAEKPGRSFAGLVISLVCTPAFSVLALIKRSTAGAFRSSVAFASAGLTLNSAALAAILGLGFALSFGKGWWWADPVAAVAMLPFLCRSGWRSIELGKEER